MTLLIGMRYGVSDEWHQSFVPGRVASIWDVLFDAAGVASIWDVLFDAAGIAAAVFCVSYHHEADFITQ